jgi:hypothetical protein
MSDPSAAKKVHSMLYGLRKLSTSRRAGSYTQSDISTLSPGFR